MLSGDVCVATHILYHLDCGATCSRKIDEFPSCARYKMLLPMVKYSLTNIALFTFRFLCKRISNRVRRDYSKDVQVICRSLCANTLQFLTTKRNHVAHWFGSSFIFLSTLYGFDAVFPTCVCVYVFRCIFRILGFPQFTKRISYGAMVDYC